MIYFIYFYYEKQSVTVVTLNVPLLLGLKVVVLSVFYVVSKVLFS